MERDKVFPPWSNGSAVPWRARWSSYCLRTCHCSVSFSQEALHPHVRGFTNKGIVEYTLAPQRIGKGSVGVPPATHGLLRRPEAPSLQAWLRSPSTPRAAGCRRRRSPPSTRCRCTELSPCRLRAAPSTRRAVSLFAYSHIEYSHIAYALRPNPPFPREHSGEPASGRGHFERSRA